MTPLTFRIASMSQGSRAEYNKSLSLISGYNEDAGHVQIVEDLSHAHECHQFTSMVIVLHGADGTLRTKFYSSPSSMAIPSLNHGLSLIWDDLMQPFQYALPIRPTFLLNHTVTPEEVLTMLQDWVRYNGKILAEEWAELINGIRKQQLFDDWKNNRALVYAEVRRLAGLVSAPQACTYIGLNLVKEKDTYQDLAFELAELAYKTDLPCGTVVNYMPIVALPADSFLHVSSEALRCLHRFEHAMTRGPIGKYKDLHIDNIVAQLAA